MKTAFAERDDERMESYPDWLGLDEDEVWNPNSFGSQELSDINTELKRIKVPEVNRGQSQPKTPSSFKSQYSDRPDYFTIREVLKRKTVDELRSLAT